MFSFPLQITEKHLDTFGHVNNAVYLELYEEARWDFITKGNFGLDKIKAQKQGPVVLEVTVKYRRELTNREQITIESSVVSEAGKIMYLEQRMLKEDGSVASTAQFTIGFMDLKQRKLIMPPLDWLKALGVS